MRIGATRHTLVRALAWLLLGAAGVLAGFEVEGRWPGVLFLAGTFVWFAGAAYEHRRTGQAGGGEPRP